MIPAGCQGKATPICVMAPCRAEKPTMKERILETADKLFYLQGIRAVGVDTIAAEIGISKRTLYNHFPSKDALITAYLERPLRAAAAVGQATGRADPRHLRLAGATFSAAKIFAAVPSSTRWPNSAAEDQSVQQDRRRLQGKPPALVSRSADSAWRRRSGGPGDATALLVDGSIAQDLVRDDPAMARAAKEAARVLLANAGVKVDGSGPRRSREA